jgi:hypothetical protein
MCPIQIDSSPRRGGIVTAGAARPRGFLKKDSLLHSPAFRCRPSGLEERYCDPCIQTKPRAILAPHGRDARATMCVL